MCDDGQDARRSTGGASVYLLYSPFGNRALESDGVDEVWMNDVTNVVRLTCDLQSPVHSNQRFAYGTFSHVWVIPNLTS